jgi:hypothetical protein
LASFAKLGGPDHWGLPRLWVNQLVARVSVNGSRLGFVRLGSRGGLGIIV